MADPDQTLQRLASLAGIVTGYTDVWGERHDVSLDSQRAVLAAMGFAVATPAEIGDALVNLAAETWRALLPPVLVLEASGQEAAIVLTVPDRLAAGRVVWELRLEDGAIRDGAADLDHLSLLARHDSGAHRHRRLSLPLKSFLPLGYHRLRVAVGAEEAECALIMTPSQGHALSDRRWGMTAQLYGLRSARNWGIGDFSDLGDWAALLAESGAVTLGINPLHALFPGAPEHASPYSPSSRLFLNPLYIDATAVPDFADCAAAKEHMMQPDFGARLAAARAAAFVDYGAVSTLKRPIFRALYEHFAAHHLAGETEDARTERGRDFRRFQRAAGDTLAHYALFNIVQERMLREGKPFAWRAWESAWQSPQSETCRAFAAAHREEIEREQYLQWEADRQLGLAAQRAASGGLSLYRDLAVGVDPGSAEAWMAPEQLVIGASVGAPPDLLNRKGQDWGLAPPNPLALHRLAYTPFVAAVRANMRHAGVLRIDHAMALRQLYWIPRGAAPTEGAYVSYPEEDLLRIVALESLRAKCAVIGEDLGTVPPGFSDRLNERGVLSYRVLQFEQREDGTFLPPQNYRPIAAATFSTHDLPTLKGYWLGRDLEWRQALGLYPDPAMAARGAADRRRERRNLLAALVDQRLLSAAAAQGLLPDEDSPIYAPILAEAIHRFLGRTASGLVLVQIEDVLGEFEQANLPGTIDEHPNWRRKLSRTLEEIGGDADFRRQVAALDEARRAP